MCYIHSHCEYTTNPEYEGPLEGDALSILRSNTRRHDRAGCRRPQTAGHCGARGDVSHVIEVKTQRETNAAAARQHIEHARQLPDDRIS